MAGDPVKFAPVKRSLDRAHIRLIPPVYPLGVGERHLSARRRYDDSAQGANRLFVHSVDVTRAGWQIPFVTSVVNTYASWTAEFAAEVGSISAN